MVAAPAEAALPLGFRVRPVAGRSLVDGRRALPHGSPPVDGFPGPAEERLIEGGVFTVEDATSGRLARWLLDADLAVPALAPLGPFGLGRLSGVPGIGDVTVIVPVRDRADRLARVLAAVGPAVPLIVVDDGSVDHRVAEVARAAGADVVRYSSPRGPAAARNAGLARARTPVVAFLDGDMVPVPGWLEVLLPHFADPGVALVAPRVLGGVPDPGPDPALVVPWGRVRRVPSAAILARREALEEVFAEDPAAGRDAALGLRLASSGWRVRYEPDARVVQDPGHQDPGHQELGN